MPASLHTHSWYSLLQGVSGLTPLLERAAACGYSALALTDTNNLYGAVSFVEEARRFGVRPVLGACLGQGRTHCVALIAEPAGYRNLCRIISRLHLHGAAQRLEDLLVENAAGLHVLVDEPALAEKLRDAFDRRLWLEIVRPGQAAAREQELLACGRRLDLRPVASTAAHFAMPAEYATFRVVTAVNRGTLLDQLPRALRITPDHHLVDLQTLRHRFRDLPEAMENAETLVSTLAEKNVLPSEVVLPQPRLPHQHSAGSFLRLLCARGLRRRGLDASTAAHDRLKQELALIETGRLASYFLVVRDIARYARRRGHGMALRGSAGNCLVCYLLEITDVNPLAFALPLERFLHAGRTDLPDIDLDFDWKVRDDVIDYVFRRHGAEHTAMISSHLFLQPRSAFREAAKVHGLSNEQVSRLLETLSERVDKFLGDEESIADCRLQIADSLPPRFPLEPERWPRIVADARRLLGRPHHLSIHPGGVVITPGPIEEYAPLQRAAKGIVITQFEKDAAERIGLVKMDLLGNRALGTIDAARLYSTTHHSPFTTHHPSLDTVDEKTIALLQQGDTLGVNQLESPAMRHLLVQMQPRELMDVIQALAMIRPGAASVGMKELFIRRRRGLEPVRYAHPVLEPLLHETQGLMLYEDDALRVLQAITGLSAPAADHFRRRVSKHRTDQEARALTEEFLTACQQNGVPRAVAADLWVQLAKFNHYSFCKSHAVSYGLIAWQAAALKAHHPLCFWPAALNNNQGMYPRRVYIEAIKRAGIPVYLPCVNRSEEIFIAEGDGIRTGLEAIASLNEDFRVRLLANRARRGPFLGLADLRRRVGPGPEELALLIRCGALDFTEKSRPALFLEADLEKAAGGVPSTQYRVLSTEQPVTKVEGEAVHAPAGEGAFGESAARTQYPVPSTQYSVLGTQSPAPALFSDDPAIDWSPAEYPVDRRLRDEWDLLGFVAGPPLMSLFRPGLPAGLITSKDLPQNLGKRVSLAGVVATARLTPTTGGHTMQFVTLEDEWGLIEATLFPGTCPPVAYLTLGPYIVTGLVEEQYGVIGVTAHRFQKA
ncbi:MAG TPA: DNA polymerase III subunit alpha [Gemmataceae bacterium]|nr:DNA polymerase III subunit alpha [Gemmataceae bacterium]